jgi:branched-chain amino acid transport system permease protein
MALFIQQIVNGLSIGSIYMLTAFGVTMIFGLTRVVNFAHGQFLIAGALLTVTFDNIGLNFWLSALLATLATGGIAVVTERLVFRPTLRSPMTGFVASLGLITLAEGVFAYFYSSNPESTSSPVNGVLSVGGVLLPYDRALVIGVALVVLVCLFVGLDRSALGRRVRATTEDPYAAQLVGIDVTKVISYTFIIGSILAGLAGAFMSTIFAVTAYDGLQFILKGFIAAVLGGLGNVRGAAIAGLTLGCVEALGSTYISSSWQDGYSYIALALILLIRPQGILRGTYAEG